MHSPMREWKKGDYPVSPHVSISLGTHSSTSDGKVFLSPLLMSDLEIDEAVDGIKSELEEFRRKGKRELKSLRKKMINNTGLN